MKPGRGGASSGSSRSPSSRRRRPSSSGCRPRAGHRTGPAPLAWTGAASCEECHAEETRSWRGSHHDLAMQEPSEKTVLGDFDDRRFTHEGVTTRFYRKDGRSFVRTDGPDGRPADYPVAYVFGLIPLQQYLVELPGGRLQALSVAWDSRPKDAGRPALVPPLPGRARGPPRRAALDEALAELEQPVRRVPLHEPAQGLPPRRGPLPHDLLRGRTCPARRATGRARATWTGRGRRRRGGRSRRGSRASSSASPSGAAATWEMDEKRGIAKPTKFLATRFEVETCARCHARRGLLTEEYRPGRLLSRDAPPGASRGGSLLRGRADAGRGLQLGLVPAEQDVRDRASPARTATSRTA